MNNGVLEKDAFLPSGTQTTNLLGLFGGRFEETFSLAASQAANSRAYAYRIGVSTSSYVGSRVSGLVNSLFVKYWMSSFA
jgi:hypothetical protein